MENEEIIPRIRELITDSLLTEAAFADKVGLSPSNLYKKLRGNQTITHRDIKYICDAMMVYPEWLQYGTGPKYRPVSDLANTVKNAIIDLAQRLTQNQERIESLKRDNQDIMSQLSALYMQLNNKL